MAAAASIARRADASARTTVWGTALLYGHDVVSVLVSFLLTPYIAATVGQYRFGLWSVIISSISVLGILELGLGPAVIKIASEAVARDDLDDLHRTLASACVLTAALALLVFALPAGLLLVADQFRDAPLTREVRLAALLVAANMALSVLEGPLASLLYAFSRLKQLAAARLAGLAIFAVVTVLSLRAGWGLIGLGAAWVASQLARTLCDLAFAHRLIGLRFLRPRRLDPGKIRALWGFSSYSSLGTIAYLTVANADNMIIGGAVGAAAVAAYAATYRVPALGARLLRLMASSLFPHFCRHSGAGQLESSRQAHRLLVSVSAGVGWSGAALALIAGREFVSAWITPEYFSGYPILLSAVLSMVAIGYIAASQGVGMAWGKVRDVYLLSAAEAAVNIVLSLVLVGPLGPAGVAVATLAPQALLSLLVLPRLVCRLVGDSVLLYYLSMLKSAALFAAVALAGRALVTAAGGGLWIALAVGVLAAALYALLYFALILRPDERGQLLRYSRIR